jgi:hypothetical protein
VGNDEEGMGGSIGFDSIPAVGAGGSGFFFFDEINMGKPKIVKRLP